MLTRSIKEGRVEAAATGDLDTKKYTWHVYTSPRGLRLKGTKNEATLRKGDYFGVKEFTTKDDKILVLNANAVFKLPIAKSEKLMEEKGKECRGGKLPATAKPKAAPTKVKINMDEKPAAKTKKDDFTYILAPVVCDHCGKKAKHGLKIGKKTYAESCAADKLGLTLSSLRKMYAIKDLTKPAAYAKPAKVKLTANQKAIAALKVEIKRIKGLTQNTANLRKIAKLKDDLKKKQAKEKGATPTSPKTAAPKAPKQTAQPYAGPGKIEVKADAKATHSSGDAVQGFLDGNLLVTARRMIRPFGGRGKVFVIDATKIGGERYKYSGATPEIVANIKSNLQDYLKKLKAGKVKAPFVVSEIKEPTRVKETSAPVNPAKEAKRTAKKADADLKLAPEYETARKMLNAIDKGGVPLNPTKLNNVGRELGLEISRNAKPEDTIQRIRAAVQRAIETARAEQNQAATKPAAPKKVKVTITPHDDDDDLDIPHGSVRYGGKLIEPDELEFDSDLSGINLPVDESWSNDSNAQASKEPEEIVIESGFKSKRPH